MDLHLKSCITIDLFPIDTSSDLDIPFFKEGISAGFPSPALDFGDLKIDLNKHMIRNPSATFLVRLKGSL